MFSGVTRSACGAAQSAMGPFYCPNDREVYLDTAFFRDLETRFRGCSGKACEFSQAYVIAHEVGHHVQNLLGILPKVQQAQRASGNRAESNRMQVQVELQADCFAGVWANHAEAQIASSSIRATSTRRCRRRPRSATTRCSGRAQGTVVPDSFTHGSAEQRKRWFIDRLQGRHRQGLQHLRRGAALIAPTMPGIDDKRPFVPLKIAVLTVSDTRELADDKSGATLAERIEKAGHAVAGARHRHRRRREDPRADADLDRRQRRSTSSSRPAAPASPAAT